MADGAKALSIAFSTGRAIGYGGSTFSKISMIRGSANRAPPRTPAKA